MTQYHKYLKDWTSERGITSFLGSDKPAFQQDWKEEKRAGVRFGEEMGREDINRAGEPFKKPIPIQKIKEAVSKLPPVSEGAKALSKILTSKEFDDTIEEGIKDLYYSQFPFPDMISKDKLYKDKFLSLSKKKQDEIRNIVRKQLTKQLITKK